MLTLNRTAACTIHDVPPINPHATTDAFLTTDRSVSTRHSFSVPPADQPKQAHYGSQVVVRLFQDARQPCADFFVDGFDKIIIPCANLTLKYKIMGTRFEEKLTAGQAIFMPNNGCPVEQFEFVGAEFLMIDLSEDLRKVIYEYICLKSSNVFDRITLLEGTQNLLAFAHTARRFLMSPLKESETAIEALGVIVISEALISLQSKIHQKTMLSWDSIAKLDGFIRKNISQSLCLSELANFCRLSTHQFNRSFKAMTGQTPHQYVLDRRLAAARVKLAETGLSIAQIAYDVGFSSQAHMTDTFSKMLSITPAKFRKQAMGT